MGADGEPIVSERPPVKPENPAGVSISNPSQSNAARPSARRPPHRCHATSQATNAAVVGAVGGATTAAGVLAQDAVVVADAANAAAAIAAKGMGEWCSSA